MTSTRILILVPSQTLELYQGQSLLHRYSISTGVNGAGERYGSGCTPRGRHRVRIRIGGGCPAGTVFQGRRPTGEVYDAALAQRFPDRDWVLTRILWLTGCEFSSPVHGRTPVFSQGGGDLEDASDEHFCGNRGGCVDTLRRFIYIHGCPDTEPMGVPCSHGCVRMRNRDLIELFDSVAFGTPVDIVDGGDAVA